MKYEFLMLFHLYKDEDLTGWFLSEKLDGVRCFWDGGISIGKPKKEIPWANLSKNTEHVCTGLWSRYGNIIHVPKDWTKGLPSIPLDGEIYSHDLAFRQQLMSIVKRYVPNKENWDKVTFNAFDKPPLTRVFMSRDIDVPNFKKTFNDILGTFFPGVNVFSPVQSFGEIVEQLKGFRDFSDTLKIVEQIKLKNTEEAFEHFYSIIAKGGEGVIVRDPESTWTPQRTRFGLKIKECHDAEGVVIGYIAGKGKLLGKVGAFIVQSNNTIFELSGFTDLERALTSEDWAIEHPGERIPKEIAQGAIFPIGTTITYKYRGLSKDGVPQEARYWRKRTER